MTAVPLKHEKFATANDLDPINRTAGAAEPKAVLVIEDHPLVAEATSKLLIGCSDLIHPVISSTAVQALEQLDDPTSQWFRIFLDLGVPGAYGLSLAREVQSRGLASRCCVVSAFENPEYVSEIYRHGFLGYITKAIPVVAFTTAIWKVLDGERCFPSMSSARKVAGIRLTRRQTQLLEKIRAGCSSKEIATDLCLAEGTVNNHVAAILQSLEAGSRAHAVARAIELGFLESRPNRVEVSEKRPVVHATRW